MHPERKHAIEYASEYSSCDTPPSVRPEPVEGPTGSGLEHQFRSWFDRLTTNGKADSLRTDKHAYHVLLYIVFVKR
jgi:hypothetical protein